VGLLLPASFDTAGILSLTVTLLFVASDESGSENEQLASSAAEAIRTKGKRNDVVLKRRTPFYLCPARTTVGEQLVKLAFGLEFEKKVLGIVIDRHRTN